MAPLPPGRRFPPPSPHRRQQSRPPDPANRPFREQQIKQLKYRVLRNIEGDDVERMEKILRKLTVKWVEEKKRCPRSAGALERRRRKMENRTPSLLSTWNDLETVTRTIDLRDKDVFAHCRAGEDEIDRLLQEHADILATPLEKITSTTTNFMIKEMFVHPLICNQYPFFHLPGAIPLRLSNKLSYCFNTILNLNPRCYLDGSDRRSNRGSAAYHWGLWRKSRTLPALTRETVKQKKHIREEIDALFALLKDVGEIIARFLDKACPRLMEKQRAIGKRVRAVAAEQGWKCPDFADAFFAVAARVGSSEQWHTDWSDYRWGGLAFIITLTSCQGGGSLQVPQLGIEVVTQPTDITAFQAGRFVHRGTVPNGHRVVFTLFTCNGLFADTFDAEKLIREVGTMLY